MALISLSDIKTELSMDASETDYDSLITLLCSAVQSIFEEMTGRNYESATFTEYYSTNKYDSKIFLKNFPVLSVTSFYDDDDWEYGSDTLIDADDYSVDTDKGVIYYNSYFSEGKRNIKVTYSAGYTSDTLPKGIKRVWIRQVAHWLNDAKTSGWAVQSTTQPGGAITKKKLENNLLPDFVLMSNLEKRVNV